jgi:hypothetical protein
MSDQSTSISGLINQQLFNTYSANWIRVINDSDPKILQNSFKLGDDAITGCGFSTTRIGQLVATVGATHIKVRFIVQPPAPGTEPKFSLALFATDALDARISSYYVPEVLYTDTEAFVCPSQPGLPAVHKNQLHYVLAERWRQNWVDKSTEDIETDDFTTSYGPLRGYTYELQEFMALFLQLEALEDAMLKIHFVLHDYYRPDLITSIDTLAYTFALALRLQHNPGTKYYATDDDLIMDNAMPCPPTC